MLETLMEISPEDFNDNIVLNAIMNYSQDTIYFKDLESRFLFIGAEQARRLNLTDASKAVGKTDFDFFPREQAKKAFDDEQRIMSSGKPLLYKVEKIIWPTGDVSWVSASKYPLLDAFGNTIGTWGISRDITAQKMAEEKLEYVNVQLMEANRQLELLSAIDSLSGLYNHRHFYEEMQRVYDLYERRAEKGMESSFAICISDIDYFKQINDNYGHLAGDIVIKHVADLIKRKVRHTDMAFRYGGDEFVILFHDIHLKQAKRIADILRKAIHETPVSLNGESITLSLSMGVASLEEAANLNDLIDKADKRLYWSKKNGRNKVTSNIPTASL